MDVSRAATHREIALRDELEESERNSLRLRL
jgi:hypothetical protein